MKKGQRLLEIERPIHPVQADIDNYNEGVINLYRIAKREGIRI